LAQEKIVVITAPSGSGKTTLVKRLLMACPQLAFSISACTRLPRNGEQHAKDYYFYEAEQFKRLISEDAFVEWEEVYPGKYYGTLRSELQRIWNEDKTPLVDIDVQGALAIRNKYPENCLTIFIEAPSLEILRERLRLRGTETEHSLVERVSKAAHELEFAPQFDRIIINDRLDKATEELISVVTAFTGC
jgi:guanylate kinase